LIATAVFAAVAVQATCAVAANAGAPLSAAQTVELLKQLGTSEVDESVCMVLCHANIAETDNFASSIKFSHGHHIVLQCSSCHPKFPHQASGLVLPDMKTCFNCHGLRHASMGTIAKGECNFCHVIPRWQMECPYAKDTADWNGRGHVAKLGDAEFVRKGGSVNSDCMRCHTAPNCTTCHNQQGVVWTPDAGWGYESGTGCQACHGSANLRKQSDGVSKSFQVTGLEDSAHRGIACQKCHNDFRYDDEVPATKLWRVNAGMACGDCHKDSKKEQDRAPVALYEKSIHAQRIREGEYTAATCGSCHGGHNIARLDTKKAKLDMYKNAKGICGGCHATEYASYDDYYHGRAYKEGNLDSPVCWQCHKAHDILPSADPASSIAPARLGATCGQQPGCHKGSSEAFAAQAGTLMHRKIEAHKGNPLVKLFGGIFKKKTSEKTSE
jgi:hypothetical protein